MCSATARPAIGTSVCSATARPVHRNVSAEVGENWHCTHGYIGRPYILCVYKYSNGYQIVSVLRRVLL